jgi:hypothetical protein
MVSENDLMRGCLEAARRSNHKTVAEYLVSLGVLSNSKVPTPLTDEDVDALVRAETEDTGSESDSASSSKKRPGHELQEQQVTPNKHACLATD